MNGRTKGDSNDNRKAISGIPHSAIPELNILDMPEIRRQSV